MWAFLAGFFGVKVLRNGQTPDSVKQARWDARHRPTDYATGDHVIGNRGFWPLVAVLGGLCVVGFVALALTR